MDIINICIQLIWIFFVKTWIQTIPKKRNFLLLISQIKMDYNLKFTVNFKLINKNNRNPNY